LSFLTSFLPSEMSPTPVSSGPVIPLSDTCKSQAYVILSLSLSPCSHSYSLSFSPYKLLVSAWVVKRNCSSWLAEWKWGILSPIIEGGDGGGMSGWFSTLGCSLLLIFLYSSKQQNKKITFRTRRFPFPAKIIHWIFIRD
jgi:hypothetical protein